MPTEKQAAEMWCPYSRVLMLSRRFTKPTEYAPGYNRTMVTREDVDEQHGIRVVRETTDLPAGSTCIGSRCMAWRVQMGEPEPDRHPGYKRARMVRGGPDQECPDCEGSGTYHPRGGEPEPCGNCEGRGTVSNWQPVGFCGLAGKPE